MVPGICLRQVRENLGLTYRAVERSSYEVAHRRGRPDFIIRVSRLADIENGGVTPSLYKLYSLCVIYHLNISDVCGWYDVPLDEPLKDALEQTAPNTHLAGMPRNGASSPCCKPPFDPRRTEFLGYKKPEFGPLESALLDGQQHLRLGFIGTEDHWMEPLLRPGSVVLLDPARRRVEKASWSSEYDRPIYFVETREGYRCCWCSQAKDRLMLQPHPLSPCTPETLRFPDEAEIVGQVVGMAMRLSGA
ncbi:MAG: helix-turn-helix transcriptional regulator [Candidatus Acidiferrales bacterium]